MAVNSSYGAAERDIGELFADYLEGGADKPCLVLGADAPSDPAREALEKSLEALGYGAGACSFARLSAAGQAGEPAGDPGDAKLDAQALFLLIEGLDPLYVVCADAAATAALAGAYRTQWTPDCAVHAFGRPAVMFEDLDALLQTEAGKRRAWQLLKTLARR